MAPIRDYDERVRFSVEAGDSTSRVGASRGCKVVPHQLTVLHNESNPLQFADVRDWIARNRDEIG